MRDPTRARETKWQAPRSLVVREMATAALVVVVVAALAFALAAEPSDDLSLDSIVLDDQDVRTISASFDGRIRDEYEEQLDLPLAALQTLSGHLSVPGMTAGWRDETAHRSLIVIGYLAPEPRLATAIYEGHVDTVRPTATSLFEIDGMAEAEGFVTDISAGETSYRATFSQGRLFIDIYLEAQPGDDDRDRELVKALARAQSKKAPKGAAAPALPPAPAFAVQAALSTLVVLGAWLLVSGGVSWLRDPLRGRDRRNGSRRYDPDARGTSVKVHDVTMVAHHARRRARMRMAVVVIGLAVAAPGVFPMSWPWGLAMFAVGAGILVLSKAFSVADLGQPHSSVQAKRPRSRNGRSRAYGALAGASAIAGVALLALAGIGIILAQSLTDSVALLIVSGTALISGGALLQRFAQRLGAADARAALAADSRRSVLYLRAFADDGLVIRSARYYRPHLLQRLSPRGFARFEEVVTHSLRAYGPVVAVNPPGTELAPLGSAREDLEAGDWQPQVAARIRAAGLVAVAAAPGVDAPGLAWELSTIHAQQRWPDTLLLVPPRASADLQDRWARFIHYLVDATGASPLPPATASEALVVVGDPTTGWTLVTAKRRDEWSYEAAIHAAVAILGRESFAKTH